MTFLECSRDPCRNSVNDCASVSSKIFKCCVQELASATLDMSAQGGVYTARKIRLALLLLLPPFCGCMSSSPSIAGMSFERGSPAHWRPVAPTRLKKRAFHCAIRQASRAEAGNHNKIGRWVTAVTEPASGSARHTDGSEVQGKGQRRASPNGAFLVLAFPGFGATFHLSGSLATCVFRAACVLGHHRYLSGAIVPRCAWLCAGMFSDESSLHPSFPSKTSSTRSSVLLSVLCLRRPHTRKASHGLSRCSSTSGCLFFLCVVFTLCAWVVG